VRFEAPTQSRLDEIRREVAEWLATEGVVFPES
jgi:hypothetical protein